MKVLPAVRLSVWIGAVSVILLIACKSDGPNMSQVVGTVAIDGAPLAQASVVFSPESGERPASGTADDNGRFRLGTFGIDDGAIVGKHHAAITTRGRRVAASGGNPMMNARPGPPLIPVRYFDHSASGFNCGRRRSQEKCHRFFTLLLGKI